MQPPAARELIERLVEEAGSGWQVPMPSWKELEGVLGASLAGLGPDERSRIRARATAQPLWGLHKTREEEQSFGTHRVDGNGAVEEVKDRAHTTSCVRGHGGRADRSGTRPRTGNEQRRSARWPEQRHRGGFPGDPIEVKDKDNRKGRAAPTAGQTARADEVGARARWNEFGTPAMLTSTGTPLAEGLPADPVAAAQAYVSRVTHRTQGRAGTNGPPSHIGRTRPLAADRGGGQGRTSGEGREQ
jgi:hypothetical protein